MLVVFKSTNTATPCFENLFSSSTFRPAEPMIATLFFLLIFFGFVISKTLKMSLNFSSRSKIYQENEIYSATLLFSRMF